MMTDAADRAGTLVLTPLAGLLAGLLGSALLLEAMAALRPVAGPAVAEWLLWTTGRSAFSLWGFFGLGGLWGLLFALSAQNGPKPSLLAVGMYYGLFVWVMGSVLGGIMFGRAVRSMLATWPLLLACLAFGLWLALIALWSASRRVAGPAAPED